MAVPVVFDRALIRQRLQRGLGMRQDDFLGPRIAEDLIERLSPVQRAFSSILDLGTPGPHLAEGLRAAFPAAEIVRAAPTRSSLSNGPFRQAVVDEERSPFRSGAFDLVVSALALHTVNDLPGALTQVRQTLRPDGLFLGALLGGQTLQELRQALAAAELEIAGGASPRVAPFSDLRDLGHLLQRAGFALPVTDVDRLTVRYDNLFALARDLRTLGATNALSERSRAPASRAFFVRAAQIYAERFADPDERIRATFDVVWLSGWAPHESQQKPLKPGSAKMRLADALGVKEHGPGGGERG